MIVFGFLGFLAILVALGFFIYGLSSAGSAAHVAGSIGIGILGFALIILSCVRVVPGHSVGIPVTFGKVGSEMDGGLHFTNPFTKVTLISSRRQEFELADKGDNDLDAIEVRGNDQYLMRVSTSVVYTIDKTRASYLYTQARNMDGIRDRIVKRKVQEQVRAAYSMFSAEEGYSTKQEEIVKMLRENLKVVLAEQGVSLTDFVITKVQPEQKLAEAITARAAARERSLQATLEQNRLTIEAETKKLVAEKEAAARQAVAIADAQSAVTKAEADAKVKTIAAQAEKESNQLVASSLSQIYNDYLRAKALASANTIYVPADADIILGSTR